MGDTVRVYLQDPNRYTTATEKRYIFIFKDSATTSNFGVFLNTKESMMSWPTLKTGTAYTAYASGASTTYTPSTITVEYSKDKTTWSAMTSASNNGHYTASGLGLTSGTFTTLYVRVKFDSDTVYATTDGGASSTAYGTFTVTPSSM